MHNGWLLYQTIACRIDVCRLSARAESLAYTLDNAPTLPRDSPSLESSRCLHEFMPAGSAQTNESYGNQFMNKNQTKGRTNEAKGKIKAGTGKVTGDKSTEHEGKARKHGGEAETVLAEVNDSTRKATR